MTQSARWSVSTRPPSSCGGVKSVGHDVNFGLANGNYFALEEGIELTLAVGRWLNSSHAMSPFVRN